MGNLKGTIGINEVDSFNAQHLNYNNPKVVLISF